MDQAIGSSTGEAIHSPLIHILLALQLVMWSPVMCCCAIKGALGQVTGLQVQCDQGGCCASSPQATESDCCASSKSDETVDECCRNLESYADQSTRDCTCHERMAGKVQLDTGGKVSLPNATDQVVLTLLIASVDFDRMRLVSRGASGDRIARAHPPPNSLHAQRCLLLI